MTRPVQFSTYPPISFHPLDLELIVLSLPRALVFALLKSLNTASLSWPCMNAGVARTRPPRPLAGCYKGRAQCRASTNSLLFAAKNACAAAISISSITWLVATTSCRGR